MSLWTWLRGFTARPARGHNSCGAKFVRIDLDEGRWHNPAASAEQRAQAAMDAPAASHADRRARVADAIREACRDERVKVARLLEGVAEVSESDPHGSQVAATLRRLAEVVRGAQA